MSHINTMEIFLFQLLKFFMDRDFSFNVIGAMRAVLTG